MHTILYVGPADASGDPLGLLGLSTARRLEDGSIVVEDEGTPPFKRERRYVAVSDVDRALRYLRRRHVDALVVDTRRDSFRARENGSEPGAFALTRTGRLLDRLFPEGEVSAGFQRSRVLALVGSGVAGTDAAFQLGKHRVAGVVTSPDLDMLFQRVEHMLDTTTGGRIAICLAGGGIEGLLYELGVLRALDRFLVNRPIVDVDLFCGISAGAILGAFLANGISPEEINRGFLGFGGQVDRIERRELFDPNIRETMWRLGRLVRESLTGGTGPRGVLSSAMRAVPSAFFSGQRLGGWLERQLTKPGMYNRFGDLRRPLFIGATDQDTSQAVVFGEEGFDHMPIHRAVRASSALTPFYAPEVIDGRYYTDGGFSRTTNMRVAVRHGATMVILVDPLVPTFAEEAGYVYTRGGVFSSMQGVKALINGRFDKAVKAIQEMYPDVSFYLFRPQGDEMRVLSGSPMKYFFREEIEAIAYENTTRKIRSVLPELSRDFARHGVLCRDPADVQRHDRATESMLPMSPSSLV